jgi:hypothetical protein
MTEQGEKSPENGHLDERQELAVKYVKSNFFRVIHADGVFGGVSPFGDIHLGFYSERQALPDTSIVTIVKKTGQVLEAKDEGESELARELEADVVIDLSAAIRIRTWLDAQIKNLQLLVEQSQQTEKDEATHE